ncbi:MAG: acyltransferase [Muribaculaceae bacterium]|nr:acyltransferase [Muribaculaceae bacterium]
MELDRNGFNCIDLFKYIMAYAVVTIHIGAMGAYIFPAPVEWTIRQAVPFFFIVSGFLMTRKAACLKGKELQRFYVSRGLKFLRLWGVWALVYLPVCIASTWGTGSFESLARSFVLNMLFRGEYAVAWPLWYLYALAFYCFAMAFTARWRIASILFVMVCTGLMIIQWLYFNGLSDSSLVRYTGIGTERNFCGAFYVIVGSLVYKMRECRQKVLLGLVLAGLSAAMFMVNAPFWPAIGGAGFAILTTGIVLPASRIWFSLREQSMWIFYTHMYVVWIFCNMDLPDFVRASACLFSVAVLVCCGLLALALWRLQRLPSCRFLTFLIK